MSAEPTIPTIQFSVRLPADLAAGVDVISERTERTVAQTIRKYVRDGLRADGYRAPPPAPPPADPRLSTIEGRRVVLDELITERTRLEAKAKRDTLSAEQDRRRDVLNQKIFELTIRAVRDGSVPAACHPRNSQALPVPPLDPPEMQEAAE